MAKQEQVLIIEPQHELKFRGKVGNLRIRLSLMYLDDLAKPVIAHG
jgi:hypothetical protein